MMWNKMSRHHIIFHFFFNFVLFCFFLDCGIMNFCFSWHAKTKLHAVNFFRFKKKNFLTSFTMMYMFIHCIYTKYINAHIHQVLNLRPHGGTPRS